MFCSLERAVERFSRGEFVILVDDADRENEGDLIMAAEKVSSETVNFMAKFGRGLICVPTTQNRLRQLGVEEMVSQNRDSFQTDFQVSVDAARGITTGISAADRAETIRVSASNPMNPISSWTAKTRLIRKTEGEVRRRKEYAPKPRTRRRWPTDTRT